MSDNSFDNNILNEGGAEGYREEQQSGQYQGQRRTRKKPIRKTRTTIRIRALILMILCGMAMFIVLGAKLYDIQIDKHDYYTAMALSQQVRSPRDISASRGTVYDTNGKVLAMSASVENVFISPLEIDVNNQNIGIIAENLSSILGVQSSFIYEKAAKTASQYQIIKNKVESEEAALVRTFIKENKVRGVYLEPSSKRYYPNESLACQIIGFTGVDGDGLEGVEQKYDSFLTGVGGRVTRLKNESGIDVMLSEYEDYYQASNGYDITLTLDSTMQYYVEKNLLRAIEEYNVKNGAMCIVINAKTGAILANANYPNFDPNEFLQLSEKELLRLAEIEDQEEYDREYYAALYKQWRNRALSDTYEPGSVFKILTLAMALEENVVTDESTFNCQGSMQILGRDTPLHCWNRYGHGWLSLNQAIQHSCNTAVVDLALRLGPQKFYKYIDSFGLFDKTGLDSGAESNSIWWDESVFFDGNNYSQLASASFGQTFKVTPIQMVTALAAAVNGGYLMQPYLIESITDGDGNVIESSEPTVVRQVVSEETSAAVREILEDVVDTGTGKNAQVRGYRIGGKTGTSENTEKIIGEGEKKEYIVSFAGFAPADDPEIVILLLMDTPGIEDVYISGGAMAAPVVGNILSDILPLCLGISPQYSEEEYLDISVDVPRLTTKSIDEASALLAEQGFECVIIGDGSTVTAQLPTPNAHVSSGTKVKLYAGEEPSRDISVTVPQLSGMTYNQAKEKLESLGLFIRTTGVMKSDRKAEVSVQSISALTEIAYGSVIEVTLIDKGVVETRT